MMRPVIRVSYKGRTLSLPEWSAATGIAYDKLFWRYRQYRAGRFSLNQVFSSDAIPSRRTVKVQFDGQEYTIGELADRLGIARSVLQARLSLFRRGKITEDKVFAKGKISHAMRDYSRLKKYQLKDGTRVSLRELAIRAEVAIETIGRKLRDGMSIDEVIAWIEDPYRRTRTACWVNGTKQTLDEVCKDRGLGISGKAASARMTRGKWSFQEAVTQPRTSNGERNKRVGLARRRNRRVNELKRAGLVI